MRHSLVYLIGCPLCGANAGEPCRIVRSRLYRGAATTIHPQRRALYRALDGEMNYRASKSTDRQENQP